MMNKMTRALVLGIFLSVMATAVFAQQGFVKVDGSRFTINGQPYYFAGTNYWYGALLAGVNGEAGKRRLAEELAFLKSKGVTNLRVFVGAEGKPTHKFRVPYSIQPEQGKIDDKYLRSLDHFLAQAGMRDMKVVLYFTNNWDWSGGVTQYLKWNGHGEPPITKGYGNPATTTGKDYWEEIQKYTTQFYNCDKCITALDDFAKRIINHKNTVNGRVYAQDPTIMAWEIANEPRPMQANNIQAFQAWLGHFAAVIKSQDKNHLVTTGSEGDIAYPNNPDGFVNSHKDKNIDYLTIHIWPKNWAWFRDTAIAKSWKDIAYNTEQYVNKHVTIAKSLNKPLVIEEFGLPRDRHKFAQGTPTANRDKYYKLMFEQCVKNKDVIAGLNFWGMGGIAKNDPKGSIWKHGADFTCDPGTEEQGLNSVFSSDASTWRVIQNGAKALGK